MKAIDRITAPIQTELAEFRSLLERTLVSSDPLLAQMLQHVKERTGKQMRPILVFLIARLMGESTAAAQHAALSLELLHTASLIHDDIVDESMERRGKPSLHALFGTKYAVLAGDFLLGISLQQAAKTGNLDIVRQLGQVGKELSEGEIIQLENTRRTDFKEEDYYEIIRKKTAALFTTSALSGAITAQAPAEVVRRAELFGEYLGIAFQIKDDIFDYSDSTEIGKPTGNDMAEGKLTLPALYLINQSTDPSVRQMAQRIRAREASAEEIACFVAQVKTAGGIAYAEKAMANYRNQAMEQLAPYASHPVYPALEAYVSYVIDRTK